jgi:serine/threonine protein kinase
MWALGILIFRMMVGEEPFPYMRDCLVCEAIKNNNRKPMPDHYSSDLRKIVDSILVKEPHKRLTAD